MISLQEKDSDGIDLKIENDTINEDMINATFVVDKGSKIHIDEIIFDGNVEVDDKKLRRSLKKTSKRNINFFKSSRLKDEEYATDKENLIDYYNSKGYRNATILNDSIYRIDDKKIGISIAVAEGNKYYIRDVEWIGNSVYSTERLEDVWSPERRYFLKKDNVQATRYW